jgi:predicted branched-subunit amino acid permease
MRSTWKTLSSELRRDILLVCLADAFVGMSFATIAMAGHLPLWLPIVLSVCVFAGASQFAFVGLIISGGNPLAAAAAGLLLNTRMLPLGFAVGDVVAGNLGTRLAGSHLMTDESVAFTLGQRDQTHRRAAFWASSVLLFACWNLGVVIGAFAGRFIGDPATFGLDAAFPAVLVALIVPVLRDRSTRIVAATAAVIAVATTPFLPGGVPVLLALAALAVGRIGTDRDVAA